MQSAQLTQREPGEALCGHAVLRFECQRCVCHRRWGGSALCCASALFIRKALWLTLSTCAAARWK